MKLEVEYEEQLIEHMNVQTRIAIIVKKERKIDLFLIPNFRINIKKIAFLARRDVFGRLVFGFDDRKNVPNIIDAPKFTCGPIIRYLVKSDAYFDITPNSCFFYLYFELWDCLFILRWRGWDFRNSGSVPELPDQQTSFK